jgi:nucleotide-binding universal stress UspA family protein
VELIVVGTRGLSGFKKLLLGSVSGALVSHSPCSVLVIR